MISVFEHRICRTNAIVRDKNTCQLCYTKYDDAKELRIMSLVEHWWLCETPNGFVTFCKKCFPSIIWMSLGKKNACRLFDLGFSDPFFHFTVRMHELGFSFTTPENSTKEYVKSLFIY